MEVRTIQDGEKGYKSFKSTGEDETLQVFDDEIRAAYVIHTDLVTCLFLN